MSASTSPKYLVAVAGPTASGKTGLSIALSQRFGAPILSCDSRQFYREIPIGTAAPTAQEQAAAPHHFIGTRSITEFYTCGKYEKDALELLDTLYREQDVVFLVGGSGLYMDAVCRGFDDVPETDVRLREELNRRIETEGLTGLLEELRQLDPAYYEQVDRCNPKRIVRALEVCRSTGKTYTEIRRGRQNERPFRTIGIGVSLPREELYARIDRRVDEMLAAGLEEEARRVYPLREHNALQTVGYREPFDYFDGLTGRAEAVELIKRNTRRYAKRQMTWYRRDPEIVWFAPDEVDRAEAYVRSRMKG